MVYVEKGGEIIPKVVGVDKNSRTNIGPKVSFLTQCPVCGTKLIRIPGESAWYCPNIIGCPPQIKGKIEYFVSRKAMNINIGEETIELLYNNGLLKNSADLYDLKKEDLMRLDRWGEKSTQNLLDSIDASKKMPFENVLNAISIRNVGVVMAKKLAKNLKNIDCIKNATIEQLISIPDVGDIIARSIVDFFSVTDNITLIDRLKVAGLQFELSDSYIASDKLMGKTIIISGVFERHSRDELKTLIEKNGGVNVTSISSKTDFVLAGANMGPAKREKAEKLNISIISESDFEKMIS